MTEKLPAFCSFNYSKTLCSVFIITGMYHKETKCLDLLVIYANHHSLCHCYEDPKCVAIKRVCKRQALTPCSKQLNRSIIHFSCGKCGDLSWAFTRWQSSNIKPTDWHKPACIHLDKRDEAIIWIKKICLSYSCIRIYNLKLCFLKKFYFYLGCFKRGDQVSLFIDQHLPMCL